MRTRTSLAALSCLFGISPLSAAGQTEPYTSSRMGYAYPVDDSQLYGCNPSAINDEGQVVGNGGAKPNRVHNIGFVTGPNGVGVTLLSLGGPDTYAFGLNNKGQVVGYGNKGGFRRRFAAYMTDAVGTGIRAIGPDGSAATGINDSGQVVGYAYVDGMSRGFITGPDGKGYLPLGTLGGSTSSAAYINASGQVVGQSAILEADGSDGPSHAFITGPNGVGMTDLSRPGADYSYPKGINEAGEVTGTQTFGAHYQQFVTGPNGSPLKLLGSLGNVPGGRSEGGGINNEGIVVGGSSRGTKYGYIPVTITGSDGRMRDLNKYIANLPDGVYMRGVAQINNRNQIAARGSDDKCYIVCPDMNCQKPAN